MKKALITGITGQDGSYLAEFLLEKGYEVHGIIRRSSSYSENRKQLPTILHYSDLTDSSSLNRLIEKIHPDEIYNLAAQSHVKLSFEVPEYTAEIDALGTLRFLDAIKDTEIKTRFFQASTSELFGRANETPQKETTPFYPCSPYAVAKLYAYWVCVNYREAYNLFASNGILFNHESPRRGEKFVTRKITMAVAKISLGLQDKLYLGNLNAKRDWGYAKDYVEGMWRILQAPESDDFILATGKTITVRDFVDKAFKVIGIELDWVGEGINEKGIGKRDGKVYVEVNPKYFKPTEANLLLGDPTKAKEKLGWEAKTSLGELVEMMVKSDLELVKKA